MKATPEAADTAGDTASEIVLADVAKLTYEQARDELVQIVRELESGQATLAESMELWRRGEALAQVCQRWLDGAAAEIAAAASRDTVQPPTAQPVDEIS